MAHIDIFNGDADGICALTQLRNADRVESILITGVKRDIDLLKRANVASGDKVTVLDVSLDKNRDALQAVLDRGAEVFYVDHHFAGDIPSHPKLTSIINTAADVCTSILVNGHLKGRFLEWAVVGAFGDNLKSAARALARPLKLNEEQLDLLDTLGTCINYNGYGAAIEDLHFPPAELFHLVSRFDNPFEFVREDRETYERLVGGYHDDMACVERIEPELTTDRVAVFILPDEPWARRVSGVYSNDLANATPRRAHAVLTRKKSGTFLVSVRAPLNNKTGADEICRQFPTGGGRTAAAGINDLPGDQLDRFIDVFRNHYS